MRARTLAVLAALVCAFLAATGSASASAACPGDDRAPTVATTAQAAATLVCDINVLRGRNGLGALRWDFHLWTAAQAHADDMAQHQFLAHTGSDGSELLDRLLTAGYMPPASPFISLENIDWGSGSQGSPSATILAWMGSGDHRDNLLDGRVEELGVGVAQGSYSGTSGTYYVVDFGVRGANAAQSSTQPRTRTCVRTTRKRHRHRTRKHARRVHRRQRCRAA